LLRNPYEEEGSYYPERYEPEYDPSDLGEGVAPCPMCPGLGFPMGQLGSTRWYSCRQCGWEFPEQAPQPNPYFSPPAIDYVSYGASRPGIVYGTPPVGSMGTQFGYDRPFVPRSSPFHNPYDARGRYVYPPGHAYGGQTEEEAELERARARALSGSMRAIGEYQLNPHYECESCGAPTGGDRRCHRCHQHGTALDNPFGGPIYQCEICGAPTSGQPRCHRCYDRPAPQRAARGKIDHACECELVEGHPGKCWCGGCGHEFPRRMHGRRVYLGSHDAGQAIWDPVLKAYVARERENPRKASGRYSPKSRAFVGKKIKLLLREGRAPAQAKAIALSMARKKGLKVPPAPKQNRPRKRARR
jgi:hypothetical protein